MVQPDPVNRTRGFLAILGVWLLLSLTLIFLALPNIRLPGLYYDEVQCAGLARDFLNGHARPHMIGSVVMDVGGRPFPTFYQSYGAPVKSWLLMPSFAVFGASQPVLRCTALGLMLLALLIFMLWIWRWLGVPAALLAGVLLAFDPTFFFITVLDWGLVLPSFLCRFACFYFAVRWWQLRNENESETRSFFYAFLAGLFCGLGFLNKIDFAVLVTGVVMAFLCSARWRGVSGLGRSAALAGLGFSLAASPILAHLPKLLHENVHLDKVAKASAAITKFNVMREMYDGSYFYRLMDVGGMFDKVAQAHAPVFAPFGIAVLLAAGCLIGKSCRDRKMAFLVVATLFITIGIYLLPKAVKIHHAILVYPFPHLVVALAVARLWRHRWVVALFVLLVASQIFALCKTQQLIRETGGRGNWSDAISAFAQEIKDRPDLRIISLDWGFNEQLAFLTDGPKLIEPFWGKLPDDSRATNIIYLLHPPEYSFYPFGQSYLEGAQRDGPAVVDLHPWYDHEHHVAFYSLRFRGQSAKNAP